MRYGLKLLLVTVSTMTIFSCDHGDPIDTAKTGAKSALDELKEQFERIAPEGKNVTNRATEEVEKLFTVEYNVQTLDAEIDPAELNKKLTQLGQDRWDCFSIKPREKSLEIICKRATKTYLRYLPGLLK